MRTYPLSQSIYSFLLLIALFFTISCANKREEYIPYVPVNFTVDITINNDLTTPGFSLIYPKEGFGGVVVYCGYYDYTAPANSLYYAYDAACTFEVNDSCSVVNEGNSIFGECPCCHTKYEFSTGYPVQGDALYPLKSYNISILNNKLYIRN
jgi:nitrite reductase/ring-hydroxylating ferredoxin subunit